MSARDILRANGWRAGHPDSTGVEYWEHPSGPVMGWWTIDAAMGQLAQDQFRRITELEKLHREAHAQMVESDTRALTAQQRCEQLEKQLTQKRSN